MLRNVQRFRGFTVGETVSLTGTARGWEVWYGGHRIGRGEGELIDGMGYASSIIYVCDTLSGHDFAPIFVREDDDGYAVYRGEQRAARIAIGPRGWVFLDTFPSYLGIGFPLDELALRVACQPVAA